MYEFEKKWLQKELKYQLTSSNNLINIFPMGELMKKHNIIDLSFSP
jgi:hypothetical protein